MFLKQHQSEFKFSTLLVQYMYSSPQKKYTYRTVLRTTYVSRYAAYWYQIDGKAQYASGKYTNYALLF